MADDVLRRPAAATHVHDLCTALLKKLNRKTAAAAK